MPDSDKASHCDTMIAKKATSPLNSLKKGLEILSLSCGVLTVLLGLLVLFGWHTGNRTLVQVLPSFVPMQYNTALGFVLCGTALVFLVLRRDKASSAVGCLAVLIGGLTLLEYAGLDGLDIDELFMKHDVTVKTSHPGRMAPNSAICFTLVGLAFGLRFTHWPTFRASLGRVILGSLTFGLSSVAFTGYFTRLETAYGWGNLTRMAVHTSLGFICVTIGLLCLIWSRDIRDEIRLPRWLPVPLAIAVLTATLSFWQALTAESSRIHRQYEGLSQLTNLATIVLVVGILLTVAAASAAFLAQKSSLRAREIAETNRALQQEIETRQAAEEALKLHQEKLEELVMKRTRELDLARREAEAANAAKSEFLSHMSHELRTPLNGILGYSQILQRGSQSIEQRRASLDAIINCGDHLLSLINDVLDLSKIESGRLELEDAPFDLHKLVKGVKDIVKQRAGAKGLSFEVDISPEVPRGIVSDAAKIRQILVNLLGNAVKFTAAGEVRLNVAAKPPGMLRFDVSDTGRGIVPEEIDEIFDPFKQMEAGKAAGGTGLGLAITKQLAEALGGGISVESALGKGSKFTVVLPLNEASTEDLAISSQELPSGGAHLVLADGQNWTILVADDRDTNRNVLQGLLEAVGFKTLLASDGQEVIKVLHTHDGVDLVLMDVRMPRLNGIEALEQIREDDRFKDLKVIAVSASVFPEFRQKAKSKGFDDFLGKPFRSEQLFAKIAKHLNVKYVDAPAEDAAPPASNETGMRIDDLPPLSKELLTRLREALRIKNLTAIKAVAAELSAQGTTAATGAEIGKLVSTFDFGRLADLVDKLEQSDGSE